MKFNSDSLPSQPARLIFWGNQAADDFTREIAESFSGVLSRNMVTDPANPDVGFVSASIDGRPWYDTMWTRDAGVFLRELTQWGCLEQAAMEADCLIRLVRPNEEGYCTFPMYLKAGQPGSGSELDGTGAIIIGMVLLWQRLDAQQPTRQKIEAFLTGPQSPIKYILHRMESSPLIPGSGEFGGGCGIDGEFYNVVQNNLVALALSMAKQLYQSVGDAHSAATCGQVADSILDHMLRYLRDGEGTWIWAIDPKTLKADPAIVEHEINKGFGGLNGVLAMTSDIYGFDATQYDPRLLDACQSTFEKLLAFPKRKALFEKYGVWTQFDLHANGYMTGPSYGQGYATQALLLMDRAEMASRAVEFLAEVTRHPLPKNALDRQSEFLFYERFYLPELLEDLKIVNDTWNIYDGKNFDQGCGALNLVCVAEPLKIARLIAGMDDHDPQHPRLIPRLPAGWGGYQANQWPLLTSKGLVTVDILCEKTSRGLQVHLKQVDGPALLNVQVRIPVDGGWVWKEVIPL